MDFPFYVYLHTNGQMIQKTAFVCEFNTTPGEYFDSPFVVKYWKIENKEQLEEAMKVAQEYNDNKGK